MKKLDDMEKQSKQIKTEVDYLDFELNTLESKIVNADIIRENFKVFKDVYDELKQEEKYDLLHLLIKRITYYEDPKAIDAEKKTGKIKMDLWELHPIDPSKKKSAKGFAERDIWLPGRDSNPRQGD